MTSNKSTLGIAALAIGAVLASAPLDLALAKPGGGNGGGNGNGHGQAASAAGAASASAAANAGANSAMGAHTANRGSVSSQLGGLNAAHASKTAFAHANPHSRVGRIATYAHLNAMAPHNAKTLSALNAAANKTPVMTTTRNALNSLVGNKAATTMTRARTTDKDDATTRTRDKDDVTRTMDKDDAKTRTTDKDDVTRTMDKDAAKTRTTDKDNVTRTMDKDDAKTRTTDKDDVNASATNQGSVSSRLGALNAAHASKSAFAHASPNSRVGKIATYARDNATSPNSKTTTNALNAAANKTPVSTQTRHDLNGLIGAK